MPLDPVNNPLPSERRIRRNFGDRAADEYRETRRFVGISQSKTSLGIRYTLLGICLSCNKKWESNYCIGAIVLENTRFPEHAHTQAKFALWKQLREATEKEGCTHLCALPDWFSGLSEAEVAEIYV